MTLINIFKNSLAEVKKVECLTVSGVLIAVYVVLEAFVSINVAGLFKINFAFIALAIIGMLFGPVTAVMSAAVCDVIGAAVSGYPIIFWYTLIAMLEGLIYGIFLYGFKPEKSVKQWGRIVLARVLVVFVVNIILNTIANYLCGYISADVPLFDAVVLRISKNVIELPADIFLLCGLLPPIKMMFERMKRQRKQIGMKG